MAVRQSTVYSRQSYVKTRLTVQSVSCQGYASTDISAYVDVILTEFEAWTPITAPVGTTRKERGDTTHILPSDMTLGHKNKALILLLRFVYLCIYLVITYFLIQLFTSNCSFIHFIIC